MAIIIWFTPCSSAAGDSDFQARNASSFAEPTPIELILAVSEIGDTVSLLARNTTNTAIRIPPYAYGLNYLIARDPSGKVTARSVSRRGTYELVQVAAGETKLMQRIPLAFLMSGDDTRAFDNDACWRFLWVVELGEGDKRTRYTSNVLVLSRQKSATQKQSPAGGQEEGR